MSVLIKGISMPHGEYEGIMFAIYDGEAYDIGTKQKYDAVEVPQHGDLIDASTKITVKTLDEMTDDYFTMSLTVAEALEHWTEEGCPPAIIKAEGT